MKPTASTAETSRPLTSPAPRECLFSDAEFLSIRESLQGLRYGSVHITVHDGRIVQIDRTEKQRIQPGSFSTNGQ